MLYCIDLNTSQIHVLGCRHIPQKSKDKGFLGRFNNQNEALEDAKRKGYSNAVVCLVCCPSPNNK